jgi:hypothetical protein
MSLSYTLLVLLATADAKYILICTDVGTCGIESEIIQFGKTLLTLILPTSKKI